jgi:hypothetical protein
LAKAVDEESKKGLLLKVELLEEARHSSIGCRVEAMTPASIPCW